MARGWTRLGWGHRQASVQKTAVRQSSPPSCFKEANVSLPHYYVAKCSGSPATWFCVSSLCSLRGGWAGKLQELGTSSAGHPAATLHKRDVLALLFPSNVALWSQLCHQGILHPWRLNIKTLSLTTDWWQRREAWMGGFSQELGMKSVTESVASTRNAATCIESCLVLPFRAPSAQCEDSERRSGRRTREGWAPGASKIKSLPTSHW